MVVCLSFGLAAGVMSAFLSGAVIKDNKFRDVSCAAAFFMSVQFVSAIVAFAAFFFIGTKVNADLERTYPGLAVQPSYSVFLAVICAGLVLIGLVATSAIGNCGRNPPRSSSASSYSSGDLELGPGGSKVGAGSGNFAVRRKTTTTRVERGRRALSVGWS